MHRGRAYAYTKTVREVVENMAYETRSISQQKAHSISLDSRKSLSISGVEKVESFDESEVVMMTSEGNLIIRGSGMHMGHLDLEAGQARVEGMISELCYEEVAPSGSLWTRLFH